MLENRFRNVLNMKSSALGKYCLSDLVCLLFVCFRFICLFGGVFCCCCCCCGVRLFVCFSRVLCHVCVAVLNWIILGGRNCLNTVGNLCLTAEACMQQGSTSVHFHNRHK